MPTSAGRLTRTEAVARARLLSDVSYDLELDVRDVDAPTFTTTTTVRFACARPGATTHLDLAEADIESMHLNGRDLGGGDLAGDEGRIALSALAARNELRVTARGHYQNSGVGLHRFRDPTDGESYLYTQFEPFDAHRVLACFDQPDLKGPLRLTVHAPGSWTVVSNSPVAERDGDIWRFEPTPPLAPYLYCMVAGPFDVETDLHRDVPLAIYSRRSMTEHLEHDELFALTRAGLDFFEDTFARPYPFDKYDQLFVPEFVFGAMENPGCVTFSESYVFRGQVTDAKRESRANTLFHEMAHMWFGDLVTMRWWDDLWLNESFATFMGYLACERATRFTNAWVTFADEEKAWGRKQDQLPTTHPIVADAETVEEVMQNFDGITYAKGASVLRQLVAWVGEDRFLAGCRGYFARFAWGNAELSDFLRELEGASDRDLGAWAKQWLTTAGMNTLEFVADDRDGVLASPVIRQFAPDDWPTLRPHRVTVGLYDLRSNGERHDLRSNGERHELRSNGERHELALRRRVELDVDGSETPVRDLEGQRAADLVLVDDADLSFVKRRLDARSLETVTSHLAVLDDALARNLCWSAAWDMVRDGVMPAARYVGLVRNNAAGETEIGALQTILARTLAAIEFYGDPSRARDRLDSVATDARTRLEASPPGSDTQLVWARHWMSAARDPRHTTAVRRLLDGDLRFEGLAVDTELRWHAVRCLAGAGAIGDDVVDAEAERDPTDLGARNAAAAKAARPDQDAKRTAWERVVEARDISHAMTKAIMGGMRRLDQAELLRPYRDRYFDVLERVFRERELELAIAFTHRMYPSALVDEETLAITDDHLGRPDLPHPMRRALLEQRDGLHRARRGRRLDTSSAD